MASHDGDESKEKKILVVNKSEEGKKGGLKDKDDNNIAVIQNKPQNLAPLSGPGFGVDDDSIKKKSKESQILIRPDEPKELAPLGNVGAIMNAGDESGKNGGEKGMTSSKNTENVSDLQEKPKVSDKENEAAAKSQNTGSENKATDLSSKNGDKKVSDKKEEDKSIGDKLKEHGTAMAAGVGAVAGTVAAKVHSATSGNKKESAGEKKMPDEKKMPEEKKMSDKKEDKPVGEKMKDHGKAMVAGAAAMTGAAAAKAHNAISGDKDKKSTMDASKKQSQPRGNDAKPSESRDTKGQEEKSNHNIGMKAGAGAAAVGGATYGLNKAGSGNNNHVSIDEKKNENIPISKNESDAPEKLENLDESSVLHDLRKENKILAEGFIYKKRPWLFCFWVKKYFILLRTGDLSFIEVDGSGEQQSLWNIKQASAFNKLDYPDYSCPYRITFACSTASGYLSFDTMKDRDYWYESLQDVSRSN